MVHILNQELDQGLDQEIHPLKRKFYSLTFKWSAAMFCLVSLVIYFTFSFIQLTHFYDLRKHYDYIIRYDHRFANSTCSQYHPPQLDATLWTLDEIDVSYDQLLTYFGLAIWLLLIGLELRVYHFYDLDPFDFDFSDKSHVGMAVGYCICHLWYIGYWLSHFINLNVRLAKLVDTNILLSSYVCITISVINMIYFSGWGLFFLGYFLRNKWRQFSTNRVLHA